MGIVRATVSINAASQIPEDVSQNVWHFTFPDPVGPGIVDLETATNGGLVGFYQAIDTWMSRQCASGADGHSVKWAVVTPGGAGEGDDEVSTSILDEVFTLTPQADGTPMPAEVAMCLSFNGSFVNQPVESGGTRPRARRSGRIYLPHIDVNESAQWGDTDQYTRPKATFRTAVLDAAEALNDDVIEAGGVWVVYSRAGGVTHPVVNAWVDDAFDTQRRRGPRATTRENRAIPTGP